MNDKKFFQQYGKLFSEIKKDIAKACPEADIINSYLNGELPSEESEKLEAHIYFCPACFAALEQLKQAASNVYELQKDWVTIEKEIDRKYYQQSISHDKKIFNIKEEVISIWRWFYNNFLTTKRLVYAAGVAVIIICSLYSYAYFNRAEYFHLALIEPVKEMRLRTAIEDKNIFTDGKNFIIKGNYKAAVKNFNLYLQKNPDHFEANFYLGLSFLFDAKEGLLGYAYKFNQIKVETGITYLNKALFLANDNMFYQEDCYWYLAKACLMKNDNANAKENLQQILQLQQRNLVRKKKAQELLEKIEF